MFEEPWYEDHYAARAYAESGPTAVVADDYHIRMQGYIGILQGCRGYTYGAHGLWNFHLGDRKFRADRAGAKRWDAAMQLPGSHQMTYMRRFFEDARWWELEPHRELVRPWTAGLEAPDEGRAYCAASADRTVVVCYLERRGPRVRISGLLRRAYRARWFDPRTGAYRAMGEGVRANRWGRWTAPPPPNAGDWALVLQVLS